MQGSTGLHLYWGPRMGTLGLSNFTTSQMFILWMDQIENQGEIMNLKFAIQNFIKKIKHPSWSRGHLEIGYVKGIPVLYGVDNQTQEKFRVPMKDYEKGGEFVPYED